MAEIGIFVGTMYGNSLLVAEEAEAILTAQGHKATVFEDPELSDWLPYQDKYVLVVTSTTGQGDLPDSIVPLFQGIKDSLGFQPNLRYGVIALGDSSYVNFCNGGKQFDALLQEQSAQRVGEILLIDASEKPGTGNGIKSVGRTVGHAVVLICSASGKCRFSGAESNLFRQMPVKTAS